MAIDLNYILSQMTDAEKTALVNSWQTSGVLAAGRATALLGAVPPPLFVPPPVPIQTMPVSTPITSAGPSVGV